MGNPADHVAVQMIGGPDASSCRKDNTNDTNIGLQRLKCNAKDDTENHAGPPPIGSISARHNGHRNASENDQSAERDESGLADNQEGEQPAGEPIGNATAENKSNNSKHSGHREHSFRFLCFNSNGINIISQIYIKHNKAKRNHLPKRWFLFYSEINSFVFGLPSNAVTAVDISIVLPSEVNIIEPSESVLYT